VYDCVGGERAEQALRAIAWEGRYLVIGFTAGIPRIPLNLTLLKSCQIVGVFYGAMTARDPDLGRSLGDELIGLVADGRLRPHVAGSYPLERAGEALRLLIDRKAVGKVVVTP
jgi:NADPH2:quinone reductase